MNSLCELLFFLRSFFSLFSEFSTMGMFFKKQCAMREYKHLQFIFFLLSFKFCLAVLFRCSCCFLNLNTKICFFSFSLFLSIFFVRQVNVWPHTVESVALKREGNKSRLTLCFLFETSDSFSTWFFCVCVCDLAVTAFHRTKCFNS